VPVLARGAEFVSGQQIQDVARFVGVTLEVARPLEPAELMARWRLILRSAQRLCLQIPPAALMQPAVEGRPGTLGELAWHIFGIGDGFIECVEDAQPDWVAVSMRFPAGGVTDTGTIHAYGDAVIERLDRWWAAFEAGSRSIDSPVSTVQGPVTLHMFLERQTWHSGQHARQIADVIERHGAQADWPGRDAELAGLPMPIAVWS